ncbi:Maf family protein [Devosia sp. CN2-171]|uniref:Maf family protein n=1 Tax=Devosia sp. CN2-171 TaxID=3400909 RepID=UPI003BF7DF9A
MLILASKSAARNALLAGVGLRFEASPAEIDERAVEAEVLGKGGDAVAVARRLAEAKALTVSATRPEGVVIGADQVLAEADGPRPELAASILHKPVDLREAARQLDRLRGRTHHLHSGVALARNGTVLWSVVETARLTMRDFSPSERDEILALEGEAVLGSVGGYRLEGPSIRLFERVEGDYFTILGLPLLPLLGALRLHAPDVFGK